MRLSRRKRGKLVVADVLYNKHTGLLYRAKKYKIGIMGNEKALIDICEKQAFANIYKHLQNYYFLKILNHKEK